MIRRVTLLGMILAIAGGVGLFLLKHEVQSMESRLAEVRRGIFQDQQATHVLKAEWTYLNDPARLRDLAARHLDLKPIRATQIVSIDSLPRREAVPASIEAPQTPPLSEAQVSPPLQGPAQSRPEVRPHLRPEPPVQRLKISPPPVKAAPPHISTSVVEAPKAPSITELAEAR
jgi:hypothetical protein